MSNDMDDLTGRRHEGESSRRRRLPTSERLDYLEEGFDRIQKGHVQLSEVIVGMKLALDKSVTMTEEIHAVLDSLRGFTKTIGWVGCGLMFVGKFVILPIAMMLGSLYAIVNNSHMPEWLSDLSKFLKE